MFTPEAQIPSSLNSSWVHSHWRDERKTRHVTNCTVGFTGLERERANRGGERERRSSETKDTSMCLGVWILMCVCCKLAEEALCERGSLMLENTWTRSTDHENPLSRATCFILSTLKACWLLDFNFCNQKVVISWIKCYYIVKEWPDCVVHLCFMGLLMALFVWISAFILWATTLLFWFTYSALISGAFGHSKQLLAMEKKTLLTALHSAHLNQYSWCLAVKERSIVLAGSAGQPIPRYTCLHSGTHEIDITYSERT